MAAEGILHRPKVHYAAGPQSFSLIGAQPPIGSANHDADREDKQLDDGELYFSAADSEVGLSDRHLEDLSSHFQPGEMEISLDAHDEEEENSRMHPDAEFGLDASQIKGLDRLCPEWKNPLWQGKVSVGGYARTSHRQVAVQDPLRRLMKERRSVSAQPSGRAPTSQHREKARSRGDSFIQDQLPSRGSVEADSHMQRQVPPRRPEQSWKHRNCIQVVMISDRQIFKTVWYLFSVAELTGPTRCIMKRYSDFKRLDDNMRFHGRHALPELPKGGIFGMRQMLDLGDFRNRRKEGLMKYVQDLVKGLGMLSDNPHLQAFFGEHAKGRVSPYITEGHAVHVF